MKTKIDAIVDGNGSYAYAYMTKDSGSCSGYGHMYVTIKPEKADWAFRKMGSIQVSCQIGSGYGSDTDQQKPYAERYGYDSGGNESTLVELEQAVKTMRKIDKHMDRMYEQYGNPKGFADFCQRVLVGSGVKIMIAERDGWANGGRMNEKTLIQVGAGSAGHLTMMEQNLIKAFALKAA